MIDRHAHVPGLRLLWADESASQAERVRCLLAEIFDVRIANDAETALQLARSESPALICVVGALRTRDGSPLSCALRALPGLSERALLFSCPRGQEASYADAMSCADDVLLTPFSDCELTTRLRSHARLLRKEESVHDVLLSSMGHELRTPITAIQLWVGSLRGTTVSAKDHDQALNAIAASAQSQARRIDDLLDLSRLSLGNLTLDRTTVCASVLLQAARDELGALAAAKHIMLRLELAEPLGDVDVDAKRVRQVLAHLLTNAITFTREGGLVTLRARRSDSGLEFEVSDNGRGFDLAKAPLFQPLRQLGVEEAQRRPGLGIGLALSHLLVELHGGTIEAESAGPGCGANFRVHLPQSRPVASYMPPRSAAAIARRRLRGHTVLLVEDHEETREAMQLVLERAGGRVLTAEHGEGALALLAADGSTSSPSAVDVLVCDLGLPDMSGYELMQRLRKAFHSRNSNPPPACAVSAHARQADRQRAIRAGFDLHLAKPMSAEALVEAVDDLCQLAAAKPTAELAR